MNHSEINIVFPIAETLSPIFFNVCNYNENHENSLKSNFTDFGSGGSLQVSKTVP